MGGGGHPGLSRWTLNAITSILIRGGVTTGDREGHVTMTEAETSVMSLKGEAVTRVACRSSKGQGMEPADGLDPSHGQGHGFQTSGVENGENTSVLL